MEEQKEATALAGDTVATEDGDKCTPNIGHDTPEKPFENIPKGYTCTAKGVCQMVMDKESGKEKPQLITFGPVLVKAISCDINNENSGLLVWWKDRKGAKHEKAIPCRLIHAQGIEAAQMLIDGHLHVVHGREKALLRYLSMFKPKKDLTAATKVGWLDDSFVLPYEVVNQPKGSKIVYQPPGNVSVTAKAIKRGGSFSKWKKGMKNVSPMVKFEVCLSLSAPIKFKVNAEAGGIHIYDGSSQGKTTALQAGASVWGKGGDPAIYGGSETIIQRWNKTDNALEGTAEIFNDIYFPIDEVGESDSKEFGRTIYRVVSGTGKGRANRDGGLRESKSWRITIASAGEVAVADFIEQGGGRVKGGQLVRLIDIDLASTGEKLFNSGAEANAMKELCVTHYGHAGPQMLSTVTDIAGRWDKFDKTQFGAAHTPLAERARARFALVAFAGVISVEAEVLPWTKKDILDAVKLAYKTWHNQINKVSDTDRGIESVKDFILKHESRFEADEKYPPRDRAGWIRGDMHHFTSEAFKEACGDGDPDKVKKALKDAGLLHTANGRNTSVIKVAGKNTRVISVKSGIFEDDDDSATGATGEEPQVVAAETRIDTDSLPVEPVLPPKNDNPESNQNFDKQTEKKPGMSKNTGSGGYSGSKLDVSTPAAATSTESQVVTPVAHEESL